MKKLNILIFIIFTTILTSAIYYKNNNTLTTNKSFIDINITAKSAIVINAKTKEIYFEKNSHIKMLPASITKILTCITAIITYDLDNYVIIDNTVNKIEGSSIYLKPGDIISIKDLLYGSMLCSGNDASIFLSKKYSGEEEDFVYLMNQLCKKIGANSSIFNNPTGLDSESQNYTTAYDMAIIMSYALENEIFRKINNTISYSPTIYSNSKLYFFNKHKLIRNYNGYVTGGKTGYTKKAGRTLVTSFMKNNIEIIVVTLNDPNDWHTHLTLAEVVFEKVS